MTYLFTFFAGMAVGAVGMMICLCWSDDEREEETIRKLTQR